MSSSCGTVAFERGDQYGSSRSSDIRPSFQEVGRGFGVEGTRIGGLYQRQHRSRKRQTSYFASTQKHQTNTARRK